MSASDETNRTRVMPGAAPEQEAPEDPRWEALSEGRLSAEEAEALRQAAPDRFELYPPVRRGGAGADRRGRARAPGVRGEGEAPVAHRRGGRGGARRDRDRRLARHAGAIEWAQHYPNAISQRPHAFMSGSCWPWSESTSRTSTWRRSGPRSPYAWHDEALLRRSPRVGAAAHPGGQGRAPEALLDHDGAARGGRARPDRRHSRGALDRVAEGHAERGAPRADGPRSRRRRAARAAAEAPEAREAGGTNELEAGAAGAKEEAP